MQDAVIMQIAALWDNLPDAMGKSGLFILSISTS